MSKHLCSKTNFRYCIVILVAVLGVAIFSGCGGDKKPAVQPQTSSARADAERQIRAVVSEFGAADLGDSADDICNNLLSKHAATLVAQNGSCVASIKKMSAIVKSLDLTVKSIDVKSDKTATVRIGIKVVTAAQGASGDPGGFAQEQTAEMLKEDGKWKLDFNLGSGAAALAAGAGK